MEHWRMIVIGMARDRAQVPTAHGSGYKKPDLLTVNREKGKYRVENRVERA
ncbi:hypothetical protein [uncultured Paenibacillus sp.]|uniref:hypothetical protein n=1 Tax=uncultured Paenibacillus sp. TaxID=227322 RepID=UPI0015A7708F|nr:hypothetical protein [uncultured Paenibacillus sp.]